MWVYCHVITLSVFNNPSQTGLWIVWWKVSQEGIYIYHYGFFSMQMDMETKRQTENLLMLNAIIPKACKKWSRNGKGQVFRKLYYWLLWVLWLSILKDLLPIFLHLVLFYRLWNSRYFFSEIYVSLINCDITFWI